MAFGKNKPQRKTGKGQTKMDTQKQDAAPQPSGRVESFEDQPDREPVRPPKTLAPAEIAASERFQQIHGDRWQHRATSPIRINKSELQQIEPLLKTYLKMVFGKSFEVGWFIDRDLGDREARGWKVANISDFPRDERDKPTWSDGIALRYRMRNAEDGTIRWGATSKFYFCYILTSWRDENKAEEKAVREAEHRKHVPNKESRPIRSMAEVENNPDLMESYVTTSVERASVGKVQR